MKHYRCHKSAPGEGNSNPLQYSCLGSPLVGSCPRDCKSVRQTQLSNYTATIANFHSLPIHFPFPKITTILNLGFSLLIHF